MRPQFKKYAFALLLSGSLLISSAQADGGARILYHQAVKVLASESVPPSGEDANEVFAFQAFGRQFKLNLKSNRGLLRRPAKSNLALLKGKVSGDPISWVRLTRRGNELSGLIRDETDLYVIEPRARVIDRLVAPNESESAENIIYRLADSEVPLEELSCGTEISSDVNTSQAAYNALIAELADAAPTLAATIADERITIGILADHNLHQLFAPNTELEILDRLNVVDGIFNEALGIEISVDEIIVFTNENSDPFGTGPSANSLLDQVRDYRISNQLQLGLTHLITGRNLSGKTAGLAYVGQPGIAGACTDTGAALTEKGSSSFISALLIAHEIGHNMGAGHDGENKSACEAEPETFLMAPVINGNDEFSNCSVQSMQLLVNAASCINAIPDIDLILRTPVDGSEEIEVPLGGEFNLLYEIANVGTAAANDVVVKFQIPEFFSLTGLMVNGGNCTIDTAECVLDRLSGGAVSVISATLTADSLGSFPINLDVSTPDDRDITSNTQSTSVIVIASPDLRVSLSDIPSMPIGESAQASIFIENNSSVIATNVQIDVSSTNGLRIDNLTLAGGSCLESSCAYTTLAGFETARIDAMITGENEGATSITAQAIATQTDVMPQDNIATRAVSVTTPVTAPTSTNSNASASDSGGGGATHWLVTFLLLLTAAFKRTSSSLSQLLAEMHKYRRLRPRQTLHKNRAFG